MPRVVAAETLDHLPPDDPAAQRSRRDLVRVHQAMGTRSIMVKGWRSLLAPPIATGQPLQVLELGAGDGTLLLGLARVLAHTPVRLTLLDRQHIVSPATLAAYAALGWQVQVQVTDVLDWAKADAAESDRTFDLISTTLFLHHFEGAALQRLLAAVAARTERFFACEPGRRWLALAGSHLIGAIGANQVTREDAVLSVHAGFRDDEISAQWPERDGPWQLREYRAGLFSHCFSARRAATTAAAGA